MTVLACKPRSLEAIAEAVALLDPENNPDLQRRDVTGDGKDETWCNVYVHRLTAILECAVPELLANAQLIWLRDEGPSHGWLLVSPTTAMEAASRGEPAIVGWIHPLGHHGHIAFLRATPPSQHGVFISQCGAVNFASGPLISGFGYHAPLLFFVHA